MIFSGKGTFLEGEVAKWMVIDSITAIVYYGCVGSKHIYDIYAYSSNNQYLLYISMEG